jgi:hypothetical protein
MNDVFLTLLAPIVVASLIASIANLFISFDNKRSLKEIEKLKIKSDFLSLRFSSLIERHAEMILLQKESSSSIHEATEALKSKDRDYFAKTPHIYNNFILLYERSRHYLEIDLQEEINASIANIASLGEPLKSFLWDEVKPPLEALEQYKQSLIGMENFKPFLISRIERQLARIIENYEKGNI